MNRIAVCLFGPTASGKTDIAIRLCKRFPFDVISVDSALVYRGMDIGTAKPDRATLERTPHRLIDIRDPEETYSAGDFVRDALAAMEDIFAASRIPLLVGGTMMYFRALTDGLAELPSADAALREEIDAEAAAVGWPAMHGKLSEFDPVAAARIKPNDSQRIQRAMEVYRLSGRPLSEWQTEARHAAEDKDVRYIKIGLFPKDRTRLHERIEARLNFMINNGLVEEVKTLSGRHGLTPAAASMRAVGYRQVWEYVADHCSLDEARYRALVATRQLAKRQLTWLRAEHDMYCFDPLEADVLEPISATLATELY